MGLETGTFINDLNESWPVGDTDVKAQGDDHLRLIKKVLKNTFPNASTSIDFDTIARFINAETGSPANTGSPVLTYVRTFGDQTIKGTKTIDATIGGQLELNYFNQSYTNMGLFFSDDTNPDSPKMGFTGGPIQLKMTYTDSSAPPIYTDVQEWLETRTQFNVPLGLGTSGSWNFQGGGGASGTNVLEFYVNTGSPFLSSTTRSLTIKSDNVLNVGATANYETLLTNGNDIPNKQYVDTYFLGGSPTPLYPGGNVSDLVNDAGYVTSTDAVNIAGGTGINVVAGSPSYTISFVGMTGGDVIKIGSPDYTISTEMARVAGSTYYTVQHMQDIFHSSGNSSGGVITATAGSPVVAVDVTAGTGFIRATDSGVAEILFFDYGSGSALSVPKGTTRYIGVEYNAGTPQVVVRSSNDFDFNTEYLLGSATNENGTIHISNTPIAVGDHAGKMIRRLDEVMGVQRDNITGGLALGETGTRNITVSAGALWDKLARFTISAFDSSAAGTFDRYYRDGSGGWTFTTGNTQWDNTQYDDGSGTLATMTNGRYSNQYFYLDLDGHVSCVYGQAQYTSQALAEDEALISTLPDRIVEHSILIGRITFVKSASTTTSITSAFVSSLTGGASVSDHGGLSGLTDDDHTQYLLVDGTRATTGDLTLGGNLVMGGSPSFDIVTTNAGWISVTPDTTGRLYLGSAGGVFLSGNLITGGNNISAQTTDDLTISTSSGTLTLQGGSVVIEGQTFPGSVGTAGQVLTVGSPTSNLIWSTNTPLELSSLVGSPGGTYTISSADFDKKNETNATTIVVPGGVLETGRTVNLWLNNTAVVNPGTGSPNLDFAAGAGSPNDTIAKGWLTLYNTGTSVKVQ